MESQGGVGPARGNAFEVLVLQDTKPIYSFEDNGDYVLDLAWSPIHPALFAAVDGGGRLDLWNLNQDTEVPAAGVLVDGCPALNRVSWTPSGLHVTVGDNQGKIWVYDVAEVIFLYTICIVLVVASLDRPSLIDFRLKYFFF